MALDYKEDLIERLKTGERSAQNAFYHAYADAMYNICRRMLPNVMDAEDVLQASFMDAFNNISSYNFSATPGAWLKRIVINNCINHLRKMKVHFVELNESMPQVESVSEIENNELDVNLILNAMEELADGYRIVLNLYLLEGYDHGEISEILGISESTSKSQYSRARNRLKLILKNKEAELYR